MTAVEPAEECPAGGEHVYRWMDMHTEGPCAYFTPGWYCDECGEKAADVDG